MSACQFTLFDTPLPLVLDDLDGSELDVFFATGIVNPFGPTLSVVAAAGKTAVGNELPIVEIMLNPFSQNVLQIGKMLVGSEWRPTVDLAPLIERDYGSCPTIVLVSNHVSDCDRPDLVAQILASYGDQVKNVAQMVKKYLGDPWARVSEELRQPQHDPDERSGATSAKELAAIVLSSEHFVPELQALLYAWHGSIEETIIAEQVKRFAMSQEEFKAFFFDRVFPAIWVPKAEEIPELPPLITQPEKLELNSLEDITNILDGKEWESFSEEKLVTLLRAVLFIYGQQGDTAYIGSLSGMYRRLLDLGADEDTRLMIHKEMFDLVESDKVHPIVFLPFLVEDPSRHIASTAAIDFVSMSGYVNGEIYAFTELPHLFQNKSLANRGAVFGGLVAMGDSRTIEFANSVRNQLDSEEVRVAAEVHTPFPQHRAIQFWLRWAKELVNSPLEEDQKKFGSVASALILTLNHDAVGQISEGDRNYPCHKSDQPIIRKRTWNREDYAKEIAADLYWLESQEDAPSLFSDVLRHWGLMPGAPVDKQFMNDKPSENVRLRDLSADPVAQDSKGFLSKLFGGRKQG